MGEALYVISLNCLASSNSLLPATRGRVCSTSFKGRRKGLSQRGHGRGRGGREADQGRAARPLHVMHWGVLEGVLGAALVQ